MPKSTGGPNHDALFAFASAQGGHFTAAQARGIGFTDDLIHHYVSTGRFLRRRRGVYRLKAYPYDRFEDLAELILAAGPGAVFSHETALTIHDLTDLLPHDVHITIPRGSKRTIPEKRVKLHRMALAKTEVERVNMLPVTTATRTIRDVAGRIEPEQFKMAVEDSLKRGLTNTRKLRAASGTPYGRTWKALRPLLGVS
jgi:predicted transcriptional regulator of viral defense system